MTDLKIRRIPFSFEGVAFVWNPNAPGFSVAMNTLSFFAVGFEKYICQVMQDAEARKMLQNSGLVPALQTGKDFGDLMAADLRKVADIRVRAKIDLS